MGRCLPAAVLQPDWVGQPVATLVVGANSLGRRGMAMPVVGESRTLQWHQVLLEAVASLSCSRERPRKLPQHRESFPRFVLIAHWLVEGVLLVECSLRPLDWEDLEAVS